MVEIDEVKGYYVTEDGQIYSAKSKRYLMGGLDKNGYRILSLWDSENSRRVTVKLHRLIAKYFVDNPNNFDIVNHLDGDVQNNHKSNLEWTTVSGNTKHAYKLGNLRQDGENNNACKYSDSLVRSIKESYEYNGWSIAETARMFGLPYHTVYSYIKNLRR